MNKIKRVIAIALATAAMVAATPAEAGGGDRHRGGHHHGGHHRHHGHHGYNWVFPLVGGLALGGAAAYYYANPPVTYYVPAPPPPPAPYITHQRDEIYLGRNCRAVYWSNGGVERTCID